KLKVPGTKDNVDGLNYLAGRRLHEINLIAEQASILAHYSGKVPVIIIRVPGLNERIIGQLIYFFELACGISGYILGVNPFDQPGVENYKKNMFRLLGKPGIN
ncbi:MAG: glucose-6-phosphate isomerase, partial [Bacteroidetes bacterium]|nr:glucose-6-phosphate isomerase [Bacteroidota bacterium]